MKLRTNAPKNDLNPLDLLNEVVSVNPSHRDEKYVGRRGRIPGHIYCICKVVCLENGGNLSVQASETHYCIPRNNTGPYTCVEVGYPTGVKLPDSWKEYAERWDEDADWRKSDVFAYVPVELVRELILENCPKLRDALDKAEESLVKDLDASDRKDWFNRKMR